MIEGRATPDGTAAYRARFDGRVAPDHFACRRGLWLSSVGIGTYRGAADDATDAAYVEAIVAAVAGGCNVIDTAINYRHQRSERCVGRAVELLLARGYRREELVICTKGGYLAYDGAPPDDAGGWFRETYATPSIAAAEEVAAGGHCMAPRYLNDQIERSRRNLGLGCLDAYYLHNPETQLGEVSEKEFIGRLALAFRCLEDAAIAGRIGAYGVATWDGFRADPQDAEYMPLAAVVELAQEVGEESGRFGYLQLPFSFWMTEAYGFANQLVKGEPGSALAAAAHYELTVATSAALGQGRAAGGLPAALAAAFPGCRTPSQWALQFARSASGAAVALAGMSCVAHVEENLAVAAVPRMAGDAFARMFQKGAE